GTRARARWLLAATAELALPTVISEQYPKGLGHTLTELLAAAPTAEVVEKSHFSCVAAECLPASLMAREQVIVCGMETHVCVLQT
ncbi:hydrolase, partial [Enterococcus faecium]